jgi:hypothetical protein
VRPPFRLLVTGSRTWVEWWASWTEQGRELTYAGVTVLHFDDQGQGSSTATTTTTSSGASHPTQAGEWPGAKTAVPCPPRARTQGHPR